MSFKAKNLVYEADEPAFLRRLRGQQSGSDPDRHERPIARPRRAKPSGPEDDDDAPTYVDIDTNETLSKVEYEALVGKKAASESGNAAIAEPQLFGAREPSPGVHKATLETQEPGGTQQTRAKQDVTEAGQGTRKRKAVKAVGADAIGLEEEEKVLRVPKDAKEVKKKSKTVVLSFGVQDED